ncbi:acetyl-coenzyme A transporter 1 [Piedraia hortae CBS 480.64]|uniref:Acetyl-coenzyme A transporter 1 n=1 Tax=Piedraia hortae CBS 480.64 TaxID=1314780 RepID=A0A6A7C3F1_9PEZI|nr:acetyl-coenzyme A transporter 1 [Piedraia hortae CBS 480.64]
MVPLTLDLHQRKEAQGFWSLPERDRRHFMLLVLLYFLQGIPMGLAGGSVPFLLKSHLSYGQIGVYSLASYPYSLKLLWSPIVDAVWSRRVGRRKSWILPMQTLSGLGMLWLGSRAQAMMENAGLNDGAGVWGLTRWWFALVFMCATQDIAVDGWALTLLSSENLSYASTAQTVGLTAGHFLSYTVFLALSSPHFANKYIRSQPLDSGLLTLDSYLTFWGWAYLLVTLGLALLKREEPTREKDSIAEVYKTMGGILKLPNIQIFMLIHLIAKIGFQANDAVTNLKLLDKGFSQENLALTVLIDFPFEIGLGYYAGQWSERYRPVTVWCWAFVGRLIAALFAQAVVMTFPLGGSGLLLVIIQHIFSTFTSTVMFVAISAFHAKISDPAIGGTYMTLLATVSNLGGTFPRFFILKFVDVFSIASCSLPEKGGEFSCVLETDKHRCVDAGGVCNIRRDGYYFVNIACVIFGTLTFYLFIKPAALRLQSLNMRAWRLEG